MKTKLKYVLTVISLTFCTAVTAQTDRQLVRQGNKHFHTQKFDKAEVAYRKARALNANNTQAIYNLACALMNPSVDTLNAEQQNKRDSLAVELFKTAAKMENNKLRRAMSYHNMGVVFQQHAAYSYQKQENLQKAIAAYQEALRNNPKDDETRYNLALCKKQLKKGKGGGGQNNQQQDNKDQQDKQKQQDNKEKQQNKQDQQQQQQQQQQQMNKDDMEQMLNAAQQSEKATLQRLQKNMQQPRRKRLQKNW